MKQTPQTGYYFLQQNNTFLLTTEFDIKKKHDKYQKKPNNVLYNR